MEETMGKRREEQKGKTHLQNLIITKLKACVDSACSVLGSGGSGTSMWEARENEVKSDETIEPGRLENQGNCK